MALNMEATFYKDLYDYGIMKICMDLSIISCIDVIPSILSVSKCKCKGHETYNNGYPSKFFKCSLVIFRFGLEGWI